MSIIYRTPLSFTFTAKTVSAENYAAACTKYSIFVDYAALLAKHNAIGHPKEVSIDVLLGFHKDYESPVVTVGSYHLTFIQNCTRSLYLAPSHIYRVTPEYGLQGCILPEKDLAVLENAIIKAAKDFYSTPLKIRIGELIQYYV